MKMFTGLFRYFGTKARQKPEPQAPADEHVGTTIVYTDGSRFELTGLKHWVELLTPKMYDKTDYIYWRAHWRVVWYAVQRLSYLERCYDRGVEKWPESEKRRRILAKMEKAASELGFLYYGRIPKRCRSFGRSSTHYDWLMSLLVADLAGPTWLQRRRCNGTYFFCPGNEHRRGIRGLEQALVRVYVDNKIVVERRYKSMRL